MAALRGAGVVQDDDAFPLGGTGAGHLDSADAVGAQQWIDVLFDQAAGLGPFTARLRSQRDQELFGVRIMWLR